MTSLNRKNLKTHNALTATYNIVTPMFIGDAEQNATDISPASASIKGALRFWWRALNWGRIREMVSCDERALMLLHKQEGELFGSSADNGKAAKFTLQVIHQKLSSIPKNKVHPTFERYAAARYLSYGLMEAFSSKNKNTKAGQLVRSCINEKQQFTIKVIFQKGQCIDQSIQKALIALGLLGGLGSRNRKGLGSLSLLSISQGSTTQDNTGDSIWKAPTTPIEYQQRIRELLANYSGIKRPPFTAFCLESRIDHLLTESCPYLVLNKYGTGMLFYRSWGKDGKVLNRPSEKNFQKDHDWGRNIKRPEDFHPERIIFGLPHNYDKTEYFHVTAEKLSKEEKKKFPNKYEHERRASPLFFHVHQVGSEFLGIVSLFPADFLYEGQKINAGGINVPAKPDWSVLINFLDGNDKSGKVRFESKKALFKKGVVV